MKLTLLSPALLLLAGSLSAQNDGLVGHWTFAAEHVRDGEVVNRAGGTPARLTGGPRLLESVGHGFVVLGSRDERAVVTRDLTDPALPREAFTAEAWVSIDRPQPWGGIVGLIQDNGAFERGWLLGYRDSKFCLGVSSEKYLGTDGRMTYLTGTTDFEIGRWHHVVGTYDGETMRLYVDGVEEATSTDQTGPIHYPPHGVYEIGGYHDDDEDFPLLGLLGEVRVWERALAEREVRARRGEYAWYAPTRQEAETPHESVWDFSAPDVGGEPLELDGPRPALAMPLANYRGDAFTLSALVQLDDLHAHGSILGVRGVDGRADWVLGIARSRLRLGLLDVEGVEEERWLEANLDPFPFAWLQVVVVHDGWLQRIYVNGVLHGVRRGAFGAVGDGAGGKLVVGTLGDAPALRGVSGRVREVRMWDGALPHAAAEHASGLPRDTGVFRFTPELGPFVKYFGSDRAAFRFSAPEGTRLRTVEISAVGEAPRRFSRRSPEAAVEVDGLAPDTVYRYRLLVEDGKGTASASRVYTLDTAFNYEPPDVPDLPSPFPDDERGALCRRIADGLVPPLVPRRGYCLVLGAPDGRLLYELVRSTGLQVVAVEEDRAAVQRTRRELSAAGVYGWRASVHHGPLDELPFGPEFANVVLLDPSVPLSRVPELAPAMSRARRPYGGAILLGPLTDEGDPDEDEVQALVALFDVPGQEDLINARGAGGPWLILLAGAPDGAHPWSHQYATAANTAASADALPADDLDVQWFGRPGPRPMLDRGARPPAPVAAGGYLFVQGDRRIFALDAYNGAILWTLAIPELRRTNIPRDASNMIALESTSTLGEHDGLLLLAHGRNCLRIDARTGRVSPGLLPPLDVVPGGVQSWEWGYLALQDRMLLGSTVGGDAIFRGAEGEWYDGPGAEAEDVLAHGLFGIDLAWRTEYYSRSIRGRALRPERESWSYAGEGMIVQPTIAADGNTVYFVEDRAPSDESRRKGRLVGMDGENQFLVALDLATGKKRWDAQFDFRKCDRVFYLAVSDGVIVVTGSSDASHLFGFSAEDGKALWSHRQAFVRDHHGGAMQHPAITGGVVYHDRHAVDLFTGDLLRTDLPERRGCGTIAASTQGLFYRHYAHSFWDFETGTADHWTGVRSGCWIAMIPAGGLLLAPEASSGCSCADPLQTSVAFRPAKR